ncbi:response regulator [Sulfitobacter sp. HNIBRBA2951]|uniref:response regulator n=1 Tax=Sulfitobacter aquimarinus TaxID=3158557 RepID=UPI0032DE80F3
MKILAVDDDPIILELLEQFILAIGDHDLTTAESAHDAIALLGDGPEQPFDCFLLDIQMPGMDGIALTRQIRRTVQYVSTPIVMLTAMSEKRYIDNAFAAGATDYATKPFDLTELKARINMVEHLVTGQQAKTSKVFAATRLVDNASVQNAVDVHEPIELHDIDNVIACTAMENYVAQLSRNSLFGSTVFAFSLRTPDIYCDYLTGAEFKFLIEDVAEIISDCLSRHQFLMTYAGNGTYLCITESGWRPEMPDLTDTVNLHLSRAQIRSNQSKELHPRVSAGKAIRLVWKSGDQILNALSKAQTTAEDAAAEHERLKTDFFHLGRSA